MFNTDRDFEKLKGKGCELIGKIQDKCCEKVNFIKTFSTAPEFIGNDNPQMSLASDGTKGCFMFRGTKEARDFAEYFSKRLGVTADVDSFIGYGVVYVPADKYEEAIQKGLNILLNCNAGWWVDFNNERTPCGFEPILALRLSDSCFDENRRIKKTEELVVKTWIKSLEKVLGQDILYDDHFSRIIKIGIKRTIDAHLTHEAVLDKVRNSGLLTNSPFDGYSYVDYYGKTVR